ncbi:MAG: hypothetical protein FD147_393 [Chloroflexi bacterium]|nr:MAG: hypothetical protein FD147_393 [Chloroflexota bacterium]
MQRFMLIGIVILGAIFSISACGRDVSAPVETEIPQNETPLPQTPANITIEYPTPTTESTPALPEYGYCGTGELVLAGFFTDVNGINSPTQLVRRRSTSDNVRRYASVVTCLMFDEGWVSNPDEVINGYENVIVFFDKYGKGHQYRIIIGGHYVKPWPPGKPDIESSLDGVEYKTFSAVGWINATRDKFVTTGVRQIGVDIYLEDNQGNLSEVFEQTYKFIDTNHLIEQAFLSGDGYPETVPEGFFLFATKSWLLEPD